MIRREWPPVPDGLTRRAIWSGSAVSVSGSRWVRGQHPAERVGHAPIAGFVMMRSGSYLKSVGRARFAGDPNHVTYYNPADEFRVAHPRGDLTLATFFRIRPELLETILGELDPAQRGPLVSPFPALGQPVGAAAYTLHLGIVKHLGEPGPTEDMFVEEALAILARHAVLNAYRVRPQGLRGTQRERLRRRIPELQSFLNAEHARHLPFEELVGAMGCSPWHLSRVFAEETGVPLYRYLRRLRLRYALGRVLDGATDLIGVALDTGFASHSHFTRSFHGEFGLPPSHLRDQVSANRIRALLARLPDPLG